MSAMFISVTGSSSSSERGGISRRASFAAGMFLIEYSIAALRLNASTSAVSFNACVLPTLLTSIPAKIPNIFYKKRLFNFIIRLLTFCIWSNTKFWVLSHSLFDDFSDTLERRCKLLHFIVTQSDIVCNFCVVSHFINRLLEFLSSFFKLVFLKQDASFIDNSVWIIRIALA